jgi:hypothetical protein
LEYNLREISMERNVRSPNFPVRTSRKIILAEFNMAFNYEDLKQNEEKRILLENNEFKI